VIGAHSHAGQVTCECACAIACRRRSRVALFVDRAQKIFGNVFALTILASLVLRIFGWFDWREVLSTLGVSLLAWLAANGVVVIVGILGGAEDAVD
jgi:hypothetical protein